MNINLEQILACPICQGNLKIKPSSVGEVLEKGEIVCLKCNRRYLIKQGIIDLRTGVTQKGDWSLEPFEQAYEKKGYYKDEFGWAKSGGYPQCVTNFRYPRVKGRVIEWLQPENNAVILDVGCGVGYMLFEIMKKYSQVNLVLVGLDPVESNIYWLNYRRQEEKKTNIIGILGEAEALPFRDNYFNAIISFETLEHIFDKPKALVHMHRVLKPQGRLFITTPARAMVKFWEGFFWLPQQIRRLFKSRRTPMAEKGAYDEPVTQHQLKQYLKEADFIIEKFQQNVIMPHESYFQFFPHAVSWLIIKTGQLLEDYLNPLFSWAGLHYVVEARNGAENGATHQRKWCHTPGENGATHQNL